MANEFIDSIYDKLNGGAGTSSPVSGNENVRKFLDVLGQAEGAGYNTIVGGSSFDDFGSHPGVVGLRTKNGPSTAAGKYQITKTTYDDFAPGMGISDFSPESQDRIALEIIKREGALPDIERGDFDSAIKKLGNRWASLPSSKYGQPTRSDAWMKERLGSPVKSDKEEFSSAFDKATKTDWRDVDGASSLIAMGRESAAPVVAGTSDAPKKQDASATVGDYARAFTSSAIRGLGDLGQGLVGEPLAWLANTVTGSNEYEGKNILKGYSDSIKDGMTEAGKAASQDAPSGDALDPSSWKLPETTAGLLMVGADGLGSLIPSILPFVGQARKAQQLTQAASAAAKIAQTTNAAADIAKAAELANLASKASTAAKTYGAIGGAGMTGGAASGEVRDQVSKQLASADHERLMQEVPAYRSAFEQTGDSAKAKMMVTNAAAQYAGLLSGAMGAVGGAFNAKVLEDILVKKGVSAALGRVSNSAVVRGGVGALAGGTAEALQETSEKVGQNVGENIGLGRDALQDASRDSFGDALGGFMVGGPMGVGGGALSPHIAGEKKDPPPKVKDSPLTNAANSATAAAAEVQTQQFAAQTNTDAIVGLINERDKINGQISALTDVVQRTGESSETASMLAGLVQKRDSINQQIAAQKQSGSDPSSNIYRIRNLLDDGSYEQDLVDKQLAASANKSSVNQQSALADEEAQEYVGDDAIQSQYANQRELQALIDEEKVRQSAAIHDSWLDQHIARATQGPTSGFGNMVEYEKFLKNEAEHISQLRAEAAVKNDADKAQEAARKEMELADVARRVEGQRAEETAKKRDAVLGEVLASVQPGQNPLRAFDRALKQAGFVDTTFTDAEKAKIAQWQSLNQTFGQESSQEAAPSAPNELDASSVGVKEKSAAAQQQSPSGRKLQQVDELMSAGYVRKGDKLVDPVTKKAIQLSPSQIARAKRNEEINRELAKGAESGSEGRGGDAIGGNGNDGVVSEALQRQADVGSSENVATGETSSIAQQAESVPDANLADRDVTGEQDAAESTQVAPQAEQANDAQVRTEQSATFEVTEPSSNPRLMFNAQGEVVEVQALHDVLFKSLPGVLFFTREQSDGKFGLVESRTGLGVFSNADSEQQAIDGFEAFVERSGADVVAQKIESKETISKPQEAESVKSVDSLPDGWKGSTSGIATNLDEKSGGIVDKEFVSGLWFYIANDDSIQNGEGFKTQAEALSALSEAVAKKDADRIALNERIAQAEERTATNPTEAQKEAGNYVKGKFPWRGMTIAIETPKGSDRSGVGEDGQPWRITAPVSYGYFLGTTAADNEHLDVYIGPSPESDQVFIVNQTKVDSTKFDEHKVMIGFNSVEEAKKAYEDSFSDGFASRVFGSISGPYSVDEFKDSIPKLEKTRALEDRVIEKSNRFAEKQKEDEDISAINAIDDQLSIAKQLLSCVLGA